MAQAIVRPLAVAALVLAGLPAAAQITADDVWTRQTAVWQALGVQPRGSLMRDGNRVVISAPGGEYLLPMGSGHVSWRGSDIVLIENRDGTVTMDPGPAPTISIVAELADMPDFYLTADFAMTHAGWQWLASGSPDDLTIRKSFDRLTLESRQISATGIEDFDTGALDVLLVAEGYAAESRIAGSAPITVTTTGTLDRFVTDAGATAPDLQSRSVSVSDASAFATTLVLPDEPPDLLDLAAGLRAGLLIDLRATGGATKSQTVSRMAEAIVSDQSQSADAIEQTLRLSADGFAADLRAEGIFNRIVGPMTFDAPVIVRLGAVELGMTMPLLAGQGPQDAGLRLALTDLALDDDSWIALGVRPEGLNAPGSLILDLAARIEVLADLPDLAAIATRVDSGQAFLTVFGVSLEEFVSGYGPATLTGSGSATWGEEGAPLGPEIGPPQGEARFALSGGHALADRIAASGKVPAEVMIGLRGLLAGFGRPVGPDQLESVVTLGADGTVRINGAPMPF